MNIDLQKLRGEMTDLFSFRHLEVTPSVGHIVASVLSFLFLSITDRYLITN